MRIIKFETPQKIDFLIYETSALQLIKKKKASSRFYWPSRDARLIYLHKPQIPWHTCDSISEHTGAKPCDIFTNCQSSIAARQIASNEAVARACLRPATLRMEIVVVDAVAAAAAKKPIGQSEDSFWQSTRRAAIFNTGVRILEIARI